MATVQITFGAAVDGVAPVAAMQPAAAETITSSGTSQATTITTRRGQICSVTASGGNVWVTAAGTPTASAGTTHLVPDGATRDFGFLEDGWRIAVIDAS